MTDQERQLMHKLVAKLAESTREVLVLHDEIEQLRLANKELIKERDTSDELFERPSGWLGSTRTCSQGLIFHEMGPRECCGDGRSGAGSTRGTACRCGTLCRRYLLHLATHNCRTTGVVSHGRILDGGQENCLQSKRSARY